MWEHLLKVESLYKSYGSKPVLSNLDLEVNEGDRVFLLAPNGYGKTTLLKILACAEPFQRGEITFKGHSWDSLTMRKSLSYVSEDDNLYPSLDLNFLYEFQASMWDMNRDLFFEYLDLLKINPKLRYGNLSKGQRLLVRLAFGLSKVVDLYLIDEPLSSLDILLREKVVSMLQRNSRGTYIFTSHQIDELSDLANRFLFLKDGKIVHETRQKSEVKDIYRELFS